MSTTKPIELAPSDGGYRLADMGYIRNGLLYMNSGLSTYGIVAAGTTQATATQLNSLLNQVDTVAASTGVNLPYSGGKHSTPCQFCFVTNNGANTLTVYSAQSQSDTINGTAGATGVTQAAGSSVMYFTTKVGAWFSPTGAGAAAAFGALTATTIGAAGNITETTVGSGFVQKSGAGTARAGSFTLNGATAVTVTNTTVAITDFIGFSVNTPSGTVGAVPHVSTISAGVYFTVVGTASDTSLYNYTMIGVN
jgi:hypothetical protein